MSGETVRVRVRDLSSRSTGYNLFDCSRIRVLVNSREAYRSHPSVVVSDRGLVSCYRTDHTFCWLFDKNGYLRDYSIYLLSSDSRY